jgi:hypothetical protein
MPLDKDGYFLFEHGVTLKCQIKNAAIRTRMSCMPITDSTGADGLACDTGGGKALFLFDENGVLENHKFW